MLARNQAPTYTYRMKPGHQAPASTFDAAALALAAAFTVVSAFAFYGARLARKASQAVNAPAAATFAVPRGAEQTQGSPISQQAAQSSPLPFAGDDLRGKAPETQPAAADPAAQPEYPPSAPQRGVDDQLAPQAAPQAQKTAFEPPRLQPFQNVSGYLTGNQQTQAYAAASPAPQAEAKPAQTAAVAPLPGLRGVSPAAIKSGAAKPRARSNGAQGQTSNVTWGTP